VMTMFHSLRKIGNQATHESQGTQNHALQEVGRILTAKAHRPLVEIKPDWYY
jgi:hypothetical protein